MFIHLEPPSFHEFAEMQHLHIDAWSILRSRKSEAPRWAAGKLGLAAACPATLQTWVLRCDGFLPQYKGTIIRGWAAFLAAIKDGRFPHLRHITLELYRGHWILGYRCHADDWEDFNDEVDVSEDETRLASRDDGTLGQWAALQYDNVVNYGSATLDGDEEDLWLVRLAKTFAKVGVVIGIHEYG